jgi:hypothetical protein
MLEKYQTYYITKYALTSGIFIDLCEFNVNPHTYTSESGNDYLFSECYKSKVDAVNRANIMRDRKILSIQNKLHKLLLSRPNDLVSNINFKLSNELKRLKNLNFEVLNDD